MLRNNYVIISARSVSLCTCGKWSLLILRASFSHTLDHEKMKA